MVDRNRAREKKKLNLFPKVKIARAKSWFFDLNKSWLGIDIWKSSTRSSKNHTKLSKKPSVIAEIKNCLKKLDLIDLSKATKILIFRKSPEKVSSKFKKITWSWSQKVGGPNFKKSVSGIKILVNFLGTPNLVFSAEIKIKRSLLLITVDFFDQVRRFFRWYKPSFLFLCSF